MTITILPINDSPVALSGSYNALGNSFASSGNTLAAYLSGSDIDSTILSFSAVTLPIHGTFSMAIDGSFSYTPAYGYIGNDSMTFIVQDDGGRFSNNGSVDFVISGTNTAPEAQSGSYIMNEDGNLSFTLSGSDPDNNPITFILDSTVATGTLTFSASGNIIYIPSSNYNGTVNFTFHTNDGFLSSASEMITIDVLPVNDAPIGTPASYTLSEKTATQDSSLSQNVTATDVEGSALSFSLATLPLHGNITLTSSGAFQYTPDIGFVWSDSFSFIADDGSLQSTLATVSLTISSISAPAPSPVSTTGGWGGGSYSTSTTSNTSSNTSTSLDTYASAPNSSFWFVATSDLAGQLLFTRRTLSGEILMVQFGTLTGTSSSSVATRSFLSGLSTTSDKSVFLRKSVQEMIRYAEDQEDPEWAYIDMLDEVSAIVPSKDKRLNLTKDYVLRILQFHQRRYEEMIYRDFHSASKEETIDATQIQ